MPPAQSHELLMELYISRAKDIWNTPEVVSLIVEIADTLPDGDDEAIEPPEITLDIARHVVLSDIPKATTHLPTRFTSGRISASDPLPPYDSEAFRQQSDPTPSYVSRIPEGARPGWLVNLLDRINGERADPPAEGIDDGQFDVQDAPFDDSDVEAWPEFRENQPALREWLVGVGMGLLQGSLRQYGVDRGNWAGMDEDDPIMRYVECLLYVDPPSDRQELLQGVIRDNVGDMAVALLEELLEEFEYPSIP